MILMTWYKLFIDDERYPLKDWTQKIINERIEDVKDLIDDSYIITRTFNESINYINKYWCPNFISFDHDLGTESNSDIIAKSWYDVTKWLVEKDMEMNWNFIPKNFDFQVHSMNPIGKANISWYLNNYFNFKLK